MIEGFIGVVHLPPMPGDPLADTSTTFEDVRDFALRDAEALVQGGVDGVIIENFGSSPFAKGDAASRLPPHQVCTLALVARACVERFDVSVGVNCLRNDAHSAMGIAAASGAHFIRVNVHTSACLTDQGVIEGEAHETLRYRRALQAEGVQILADVLVKHGAPLVPTDPATAAEDCVKRGLADGIIVTGSGTGKAADPELLAQVRSGAQGKPLLLGSGLTVQNAKRYISHLDGAIVGTSLKRDGQLNAPVDSTRVLALADLLHTHWSRGSTTEERPS